MIKLFSKPNCPYCVRAKAWLEKHDIAFIEVDVTADPQELAFIKAAGHKTVPQIYSMRNELLVAGGFDGLVKADVDDLRNKAALS